MDDGDLARGMDECGLNRVALAKLVSCWRKIHSNGPG